jgi:glucokinase
MTFLVGDIGGTNARFAILETRNEGLEILEESTLPNRAFGSLQEALGSFVETSPAARGCRHACFGIAGPVNGELCEITNLGWEVDGRELAHLLGLPRVTLLNDVEAAAWGLVHLGPSAARTIKPGRPAKTGNKALLASGTGVGEAILFWDGSGHRPFATESGHSDFAPADELQVELWRFLQRRHGHVSWDRLLSGPGLVTIFQFLREREGADEPDWLRQAMQAGDPAAAISRQARDGACPLCRESLALFFGLLGAEAGNLALRTLATGGVFLAGGMVLRLIPELVESSFLTAFTAKGRMRPLLDNVPVHVVVDERLALWGAAARITGLSPAVEYAEEGRRE